MSGVDLSVSSIQALMDTGSSSASGDLLQLLIPGVSRYLFSSHSLRGQTILGQESDFLSVATFSYDAHLSLLPLPLQMTEM